MTPLREPNRREFMELLAKGGGLGVLGARGLFLHPSALPTPNQPSRLETGAVDKMEMTIAYNPFDINRLVIIILYLRVLIRPILCRHRESPTRDARMPNRIGPPMASQLPKKRCRVPWHRQ